MLGSNPGPLQLVYWQSDALTTRLDLIRKFSGLTLRALLIPYRTLETNIFFLSVTTKIQSLWNANVFSVLSVFLRGWFIWIVVYTEYSDYTHALFLSADTRERGGAMIQSFILSWGQLVLSSFVVCNIPWINSFTQLTWQQFNLGAKGYLPDSTYTVTRRKVKFPYIHMMTPDDNGPRRENISGIRAG